MRLDRPDAPRKEPLAPDDWTMDIHSEGHQFVAQLKRGRTPVCRISIAAEGQDESEARTELAEKARAWIVDYLSRSPTGTTRFGEL